MPTDTTTEDRIRESLDCDPRIPDPEQVAVAVEGGTATLRGTAGSFSQRRAAGGDARAVEGVDSVDDQIDVRLMYDNAERTPTSAEWRSRSRCDRVAGAAPAEGRAGSFVRAHNPSSDP